MHYTKKQIVNMGNEELLSSLYWISSQMTKETNSARGISQATNKDERYLIDVISKRFDIDKEKLNKLINQQ